MYFIVGDFCGIKLTYFKKCICSNKEWGILTTLPKQKKTVGGERNLLESKGYYKA